MKMTEIRKMVDSAAVFAGIDSIVATCGCSVVDAMVEYGERNGIELEIIAALVKSNKSVSEKLYKNSKDLHLVD